MLRHEVREVGSRSAARAVMMAWYQLVMGSSPHLLNEVVREITEVILAGHKVCSLWVRVVIAVQLLECFEQIEPTHILCVGIRILDCQRSVRDDHLHSSMLWPPPS